MSADALLIDFSSILHNEFHSVEKDPPYPNIVAERVIERVRKLASGKAHVAICIDRPPYFRHDIDPAYKANRKGADRALIYHQGDVALETLRDDDGFLVLGSKGYEADDVIATAAAWLRANAPALRVVIATRDKDLSQLVGDGVVIHSLKNGEIAGPAEVSAAFGGVKIDQLVDWMTLVGDASDGIKGAHLVGAAMAPKLLAEFGSCAGLFAAMDKSATIPTITPNLRSRLQDFRTRYATVKALIELRRDAPIDVAPMLEARVDARASDAVADFGAGDDLDTAVENLGAALSSPEPVDDLADVLKNTHTQETTQEAAADVRPEPAAPAVVAPVATPATPAAPVAANVPTVKPAEPARAAVDASVAAAKVIGASIGPAAAASDRVAAAQPASRPTAVRTAEPCLTVDAEPGSVALERVDFSRELEPRSLKTASALADSMHKAKIFGQFGPPQAILAVILAGRELGIPAMAALRAFHIIENKPAMAADAMRALVLSSGKADYFKCTERSDVRATFKTHRKDDPDAEPTILTYTIEDAIRAGVSMKDGSNYKRNPADMLVARASGKLVRLVYPDVCAGIYAPEELENN